MTSKFTLKVRTYECDGYNHVNNANYLNYLEQARYEFLKDINFDYKSFVAEGCGLYIAKIEIEYKKPAFVDDEIVIESRPLKKGAVSGVIEQKITRGKEEIAFARVTWASVDASGRPAKLPALYDLAGLHPYGANP
ncbi:MAG: acyl-CoA thioesterase [Spirochaetaceae bacterium]|jgi:acyl-CoA thioester hydrolase|nr:acyl-CoA thioesterase [Spirochaetaceae bacterium]